MGRKQTPDPELSKPFAWGCLGFLLVYVTIAAAVSMTFFGELTGLNAVLIYGPAIVILWFLLYPVILLLTAKVKWPKERQAVLVYSDSPHWREYIETEWLPRIGQRVVILNWSHRKTWSSSLEVRLFRWFVGTSQNYNPSVLVLRGMKSPLVFMFFFAFRDRKHGNSNALNRLERKLIDELNPPAA